MLNQQTRIVSRDSKPWAELDVLLREEEMFSPSRSLILSAALDAAWYLKTSITPEAVWTTDAAREIVEAAERAQVQWLLLESKRSIFGRYPKRSVVNRVMERAAGYPLNVAVLLHSFSLQRGPVTCLVCGAAHGAATIELARSLAQGEPQQVRLWMPCGDENGGSDWLKRVSPSVKAEVTALANDAPLSSNLPEGVVLMARDVADQFQVAFEALKGERSVIVVQGADMTASAPTPPALEMKAVGAPV